MCLTTEPVGGRRVPQRGSLYAIERVLEKPTPTEAEQTAGARLRVGITSVLRHPRVDPAVMALLDAEVRAARTGDKIQLSHALARLAGQEKYWPWSCPGAATTSASSTAYSSPSWPWPWKGRIGARSWPRCWRCWLCARPAVPELNPT